ncbi:hypothetical protein MVI01_41310 [Myxococcus virescens]|uniref:Uncharacterized protein n=2 Tax=Myxococcus virescens TaxID=83456 RepID=A0A511HFL7_9BACT|nr:hypothetical protein MVI01_41310 [Myxococcus virescens]
MRTPPAGDALGAEFAYAARGLGWRKARRSTLRAACPGDNAGAWQRLLSRRPRGAECPRSAILPARRATAGQRGAWSDVFAKTRIATKADQKLMELRATTIAVSKDDTLKMIAGYFLGVEEALAEGRVRVDIPTDFNAMVRLKEFVMSGADSRQELHTCFSLEGLQARHAQALRAAREATPAEHGEVDAEVEDKSEARENTSLAGKSPPNTTSSTASA